MSLPVKILPHYTYNDYCQWEGRWEIIEGIPYAMSPAPSPKHQWINANIKYELKDAIKKARCKKCKVYDFIDIKIAEDTVVQPDAVVVCSPIEKAFLDFSPALVVEILSPATALKDRNTKFDLYRNFGIKYFIIIDGDKSEIEIYKLQGAEYISQVFNNQQPYEFNLEADCNISIVPENIWS